MQVAPKRMPVDDAVRARLGQPVFAVATNSESPFQQALADFKTHTHTELAKAFSALPHCHTVALQASLTPELLLADLVVG